MKTVRWLVLMAMPAMLPVLASCAAAATTATTSTVPPSPTVTAPSAIPVVEHFPMVLQPQDKFLTALLQGTLGVRDGYLVLNNRSLILWRHGFRLDTSAGVPRVLDPDGNEVARYGQSLVMGGGNIDTSWAEQLVGMDLPDWANGPDGGCWLAGSIVPKAP